GYQRFGTTRPNTHLVGREIIKGNLEEAVLSYLAKPFESESREAYNARKFLESTRDYKRALEIFPDNLRYEKAMLNHLVKKPRDYAGALRKLPLKLRRMLVHAYQSYLFNKILSKTIEMQEKIKGRKIPLIGYRTKLGEIEKEILEKEGIEKENFKIKSMPELSLEGSERDACIDSEIKVELLNSNACVFNFTLPKGSYATVVLREFMKAEPLNY
ncbi:MAG: tRNA pseudouridine(13) synthase TruD, partial [Candidatus Hydrothermarchaeota archaeon]